MNLPGLMICVALATTGECRVCERPCVHADDRTHRPYPGAYVAETVRNPVDHVPFPVCDPCVGRHYPELVRDLEAAREHFGRGRVPAG